MTKKKRKVDIAAEIYRRHLPTKDDMPYRQWRGLVVDDIKKELGVTAYGTLGMYFSLADQQVNGREPKVYQRKGGSRRRAADMQEAEMQAELNAAAMAFFTRKPK